MMRTAHWLPVLTSAAILLAGCGGGGVSDAELNRIRSDPSVVRLDGILGHADTLLVPSMHGRYTLSLQGLTDRVVWVERFHCAGTRCVGDDDNEIAVADFTHPFDGVDVTLVRLGSRGGFDTLVAGGRIDPENAVSDVDPDITVTSLPSARSYGFWGQYGAAAVEIADGPLSFRYQGESVTGALSAASAFALGDVTGTNPAGLGSATWNGIAEAVSTRTFERRPGSATVAIPEPRAAPCEGVAISGRQPPQRTYPLACGVREIRRHLGSAHQHHPSDARGGAALQGSLAGRAGVPNREVPLLDTRPIFHKCDETIRGHVFCSFLALLMQKELFLRMAKARIEAEWTDILRDLDALTEVEIENGGRRFLVRSRARGSAVAILRCVGAQLPVTIRRIDEEPADGKGNPAVA